MNASTLPEAFRHVADTLRVANPEAEWLKLRERMGGGTPNEVQWAGWIRTARKIPRDTSPAKPWQAPLDWTEAQRNDPKREAAAKHSELIADMLDAMGATMKAAEPKRSPTRPLSPHPLCVCYERELMGFGAPCMHCQANHEEKRT